MNDFREGHPERNFDPKLADRVQTFNHDRPDESTMGQVMWHDLKGFTGYAGNFVDGLHTKIKYRPALYLKMPTEERLDAYGGLFHEASIGAEKHQGHPLAQVERRKSFNKIFPILRSSTLFLEESTPQNWLNLEEQTCNLHDLLKSMKVEIADIPDAAVSGGEAIIIFNLLNNYNRHGISGSLQVAVDEKGISIKNMSDDPLPDDATKLGVKGETKSIKLVAGTESKTLSLENTDEKKEERSTGYGLWIVEQYAKLMGSSLQSSSTEKDAKWVIEFKIPNPAQIQVQEPMLAA